MKTFQKKHVMVKRIERRHNMLRYWLYRIYMTYRFRKAMREFNKSLWRVNLRKIEKKFEENQRARVYVQTGRLLHQKGVNNATN